VLGAPCIIESVKAGSVVVSFVVVQYAASYTDTMPVAAKLGDPTMLAAFAEQVATATGKAVESTPSVTKATAVTVVGGVSRAEDVVTTLSAGQVAGAVIASTFGALLLAAALFCAARSGRLGAKVQAMATARCCGCGRASANKVAAIEPEVLQVSRFRASRSAAPSCGLAPSSYRDAPPTHPCSRAPPLRARRAVFRASRCFNFKKT
jgi:hypothetical protein